MSDGLGHERVEPFIDMEMEVLLRNMSGGVGCVGFFFIRYFVMIPNLLVYYFVVSIEKRVNAKVHEWGNCWSLPPQTPSLNSSFTAL